MKEKRKTGRRNAWKVEKEGRKEGQKERRKEERKSNNTIVKKMNPDSCYYFFSKSFFFFSFEGREGPLI